MTPISFSDAEQEIRRPQLKPTQYPDAKAFIPASVLLQRLHDEAPTDHFTLGWLMGRLHKRSSTRHKIGYSRNKNFAGLGLGHDASSRVHRDPADVLASHFNFAGIEARA